MTYKIAEIDNKYYPLQQHIQLKWYYIKFWDSSDFICFDTINEAEEYIYKVHRSVRNYIGNRYDIVKEIILI